MATYTLTINGEKKTLNAEPDTALLWVLREHLGLTGTKYSCGKSYLRILKANEQATNEI